MCKERGFTLLEVMIALVIVAVALAAVIRVTGNSAANAAWLTDTTFAQWVALNRLAELRLEQAWPNVGNKKDGTADMVGVEWYWQQAVMSTPDETIRRIDVSVYKEKNDKAEPITTVSGFFARQNRQRVSSPFQ